MAAKPRLRLERVVTRRNKVLTVHTEAVGTSVKDEAVEMQREHHAKMHAPANGNETSLLDLFNGRLHVEFVKQVGNTYVPVEWPKQATHRLVATSWNTEPGKTHMPLDYALSVCAVPLRPKLAQSSVVIRKCMPKGVPVYKIDGPVEGKQTVLRFIIIATKAKVQLRAVPKLTSAECDILYQGIVRASRRKKLHKLLGD